MKDADFDLVKKYLRTKDNQAISQIYQNYVARVYRFVYGRVGDKAVTEDIVADTFTAFIAGIEKFNFKSKVSTYIFGIALNKTRQHWEQVSKLNKAEFLEELVQYPDLSPKEAEESEEVEELVSKDIDNILDHLPDNYRQVLELRFLQNRDTHEAAKIMGVSVGNVRVLQNRAIKKAKEVCQKLQIKP